MRYYSRQIVFENDGLLPNLLVGFPDILDIWFRNARQIPPPNALRIATPKKRLPGAGGGFLTSLKPSFRQFLRTILLEIANHLIHNGARPLTHQRVSLAIVRYGTIVCTLWYVYLHTN